MWPFTQIKQLILRKGKTSISSPSLGEGWPNQKELMKQILIILDERYLTKDEAKVFSEEIEKKFNLFNMTFNEVIDKITRATTKMTLRNAGVQNPLIKGIGKEIFGDNPMLAKGLESILESPVGQEKLKGLFSQFLGADKNNGAENKEGDGW